MRAEKAAKNISIAVFVQFAILLLQFVTRRVFVVFLEEDFLGVQGLLGNIFTLLLAADFGMSNVISFHFYREWAANNREELQKLLKIYRIYNYTIAAILLVGGSIAFLFLDRLIGETTIPFSQIRNVYFLYLGSVASSYLFSYSSILWATDQKGYKGDRYYLITRLVSAVLQLLVLWVWKSFFWYTAMNLLGTLLNGILVYVNVRKDYADIFCNIRITREDVERYHLLSDSKNFIWHKLAGVVFSGTDNIVITVASGLVATGKYSNYYLVFNQLQQLITVQVMTPVHVAVGNLIYSQNDKGKVKQAFDMLEMAAFLLTAVVISGYMCVFQPFIICWLGEKFLLPMSFVLALCITACISLLFENIYTFRCAYGEFKEDRNAMILAAIVNLSISVLLAPQFGVTGVQIGTLLGQLPIQFARSRFVFSHLRFNNYGRYILYKSAQVLLVLAEALAIRELTAGFPVSYVGVIYRGISVVIISISCNVLLFGRTNAFRELYKCVLRVGKNIYKKLQAKIIDRSV